MVSTPGGAGLGRLKDVRSGAALATLAYLDWAAEGDDDFAALPAYFPERMRDAGHAWFDVLRQKVRVTHRRHFERLEEPPSGDRPDEEVRSAYVFPRSLDLHDQREPDTYVWGEPLPAEWSRVVVLGDPGGGKSWLLRFEERRLAEAREHLFDSTLPLDRIVLPIRLSLSKLNKIADDSLPVDQYARAVEDFLVALVLGGAKRMLAHGRTRGAHAPEVPDRYQGMTAPPPTFEHVVRKAFRDGRAVVLLDAWDEVVGDTTTLVGYLRAFADTFAGTLVLTSRDAGYNRESPPLADATELQLLALDRPLVKAFASRWFGDEARAGLLLDALNADRGQLFELARNPLMLTLICHLFEGDAEDNAAPFPTHRVEVYARCLAGLIRDWKTWKAPGTRRPGAGYVADVVELLSMVAETLFEEEAPFAAPRVSNVIKTHLKSLKPGHALHGWNEDQVLDLFTGDGILVPTSGVRNAYTWLHRTFAEYLTGVAAASPALAIAAAARPDVDRAGRVFADAVAARLYPPERLVAVLINPREVVLLSFGHVGLVESRLSNGVGPDVVAATIHGLLDRAPADTRDEVLALMGAVVAELGAEGVGSTCREAVTNLLHDKLRGTDEPQWGVFSRLAWLARRFAGMSTVAQRRAAFGDVLARIGDPRFHPDFRWGLPDDVACGFVRPPAEDLLGFVEIPQRSSNVQTFFVGRWPVTVAQFRAFVKHAGYTNASNEWERGLDNHPVVHVSAVDAEEYCRWLHDEFAAHPDRLPAALRRVVDAGSAMQLPCDDEWHRAAVGDTDWTYPWGNDVDPDKANYKITEIRDTNTVGCFPGGASAWGVEEMSGNVWEWTCTVENSLRVVRGGAFGYDPGSLRSAPRSRFRPAARGFGIGFRVVVSPFRS